MLPVCGVQVPDLSFLDQLQPFFDGVDWMALLGRKVDAPLIPIVAELRSDDPSVLATLEAALRPGGD